MKTKLIISALVLGGVMQAQVWDLGVNGNTINGKTYRNGMVGIGISSPAYPLHVVQNSTATASPLTAGYFNIVANNFVNYSAVSGISSDASSVSANLTGVYGEAIGSQRNYGVAGAAGGSSSSGGVNLGGYFRLTSSGAGINAGIYADNYGYSGYGGFFVGDIYTTGSYLGSDRKLKNNIQPLTHAVDKLMLLKPSTYTFKTADYKGLSLPTTQQMGLIAQDLEQVFPELIKESVMPARDEKGMAIPSGETFKAVNYTSLIPLLIAAAQEQQKQIADQQQQISELTQKFSATTGITQLNPATAGFAMMQNEPNPFSNETVIHYTLPKTVNTVAMYVYDLTGKQIANYPISTTSTSITITSEKLAAGIYIYSIVADGKVMDSKRMVVAEK